MAAEDWIPDWDEEDYLQYADQGDPDIPTRHTPWKMKTGEYTTIEKMEDSHLLNCIRVLRGYSPVGTRWHGSDVRRRLWLNAMANEVYRRHLPLDALRDEDPPHE